MTRDEYLSEIEKMSSEMGTCLQHIKGNKDYLSVPEGVEHLNDKWVEDAFNWLTTIYNGVYQDWLEVRKLLSEEQWKRYELWGGFERHREVKMLKKESIKVRTAIISRKRPNFFKKGKVNAAVKKGKKKPTQASS